MADQDPQFAKRRLSRRLRAIREAAGKTQKDVVDALVWSISKVIRMEAGDVGISVTDLRALLQFYGVTDQQQIDELTEMVLTSRKQPWWARYSRTMTSSFSSYLGYETSASIIRNFESNLIPGLLQTREYAQVLIDDSDGQQDMWVNLRMERQKRALESRDRQFFFILDETATRRVVGDEAVMQAQLERLLVLNELPHVTIMVVPFSRGIYPRFRSPYVIFEFSDTNDDIVAYLENPDGSLILSEKAPMADQRKPSDYLQDFWIVEGDYAEEISPEFIERVTASFAMT
ncbi:MULTISPECIES: helix-turn-helix transcriptional regulator [unclassified Streptomyces]|uniref:helix-turn-helix domain-containing protein n=1 Tax=unclassified Streptomyces TaxID=2593676 RepID=UPI002257768B|nr:MULTISPECIES: helix-turn-helix transcriptional regulator [unclassified Streptomyces]MCX4993270.1 helix-turn-helix domain-containing protein [Streptomyces sp. NBC_00568]MCX5009294.1 helix-turn-helix domain-containing protein [Streptomyces sp. NBC_00638]